MMTQAPITHCAREENMKRRMLLAFIVLNVVVTIVVTLVVATWITESRPETTPISLSPVVHVITNPPGPTQTPDIRVVTATLNPETPQAAGLEPGATEGPTETPTLTEGELTATEAVAHERLTHTVTEGEYFGVIAEMYDVMVADLLCQNGMTEDDIIYPGDVLVIPGPEGCDYSPTEAPTERPGDAPARTPLPTITLQPTAENAQVRITGVLSAGDVTAEEVTLTNEGGLIDLKSWTLYDRQGNAFTFPEYRLFPGGSVRVRTRRGDDTPIVLYWDLNTAVWGEEDDAVTLADAEGNVQSIYTLDGAEEAPPDEVGE
jgi:LysM repeat protein